MTITSAIYGQMFESAFKGLIDFTSSNVYVGFTLIGYDPNLDTDEFWTESGGPQDSEHANGNGYVTGGFNLVNSAVLYTSSGNIFTLDGDNLSISSSTITAVRTVVVYYNAGLFPLICFNESDADISTTGGTFSVTWSTNGIVRLEIGAQA